MIQFIYPPLIIDKTGLATAANQSTGNASLASIDSKTPSLGQALAAASQPVVLTAAQISTLTPLTSVAVNNFPVTQAISAVSLPLPTGAATSTNQTTQNSTLSTISTKLQTLIDENNLKVVQVSALQNAATANITVVPVTVLGSTTAQTLKIQTIDDIGEYMALYTGAASSEVILAALPLGGGEVSVDVPAGTRLSIGSLTGASITSGKIIINLLGV